MCWAFHFPIRHEQAFSRKSLDMLDYFCIFSTNGLVLWSKSFCELQGNPVNKMIKEVILAERSNEKKYMDNDYMVKWTLSNDLGLVFVAVHNRILPLMYIDDLLASVKRAFVATYESRFPLTKLYVSLCNPFMSSEEFDFDDQFTQILAASEDVSQKTSKPTVVRGLKHSMTTSSRENRV